MSASSSSAFAFILLAMACHAYIPYWKDYWLPNYYPYDQQPQSHKQHPNYVSFPQYPFHPKYFPNPRPSRGEDAYPGRFLGMGRVNTDYAGRQLELVCTLNSADAKIVSNVVWAKVQSPNTIPDNFPPYPYPKGNYYPPYPCHKCTYYPINHNDQRIKAYEYQGKSILLIQEIFPEDYGIYRCSATSEISPRGDIETVYQIVKV